MGTPRSKAEDILRPRTVVLAHGGDDHGRRHAPAAASAVPGAVRERHRHAAHGAPSAPLVGLGERGSRPNQAQLGAKAASLSWLAGRGVPVPPGIAVPADVAAGVVSGDRLVTELVAGALERWLDPGGSYAVRSSAVGEDGAIRSFAGRLETRLSVPASEVVAAVRAVASADPARLAAHADRSRAPIPTRVGVVVQVMVAAACAGISFSRNPITGLDEVVVEAVSRGGDALTGAGVTPDRWIWRWGAFTEAPAQPRVPTAIVEAVARETARLARAYGRPVDLEWAHDGTTIWWLQARPMTGLDNLRVYSNRIARDVLPGVIKPLVWSVNVPVVNAAWIELLEELVGPLGVRPDELARSFGYRAYFDMTTLGSVFEALGMPRDSLELLLGLPKGPEAPRMSPSGSTLRHLPRVLAAARRTLRRGRWARAEVRALEKRRAALADVNPAGLDEAVLIARTDDLAALARRAAYANIVIPLVMLGYERALELQFRAAGVDAAAVDPAATRRDRAGWDPNSSLDALRTMVEAMPAEARDALAERHWEALRERDDLAQLAIALEAFVTRFGHLGDSGNDFSRPSLRENPDAVIDLVLAHPERGVARERLDLAAVEALLPRARRPLLRLLWRRSGAFRVYREAVGTTWTRCYELFRGTFLALGLRLVERDVLDAPDDVFYLAHDELRTLVVGGSLEAGEPRILVARRRAEVAEAAELVMPDIVYGDAFVPRRRDELVRATLEGIPTSRGSVRGPARVVRGTADFGRVAVGDVIVIPFSDVSWTPLFARASGVVAEAGGISSHSSIVAREYGIPCIVSVADACSLIPDGATVSIDGTAGVVVVEDAVRA